MGSHRGTGSTRAKCCVEDGAACFKPPCALVENGAANRRTVFTQPSLECFPYLDEKPSTRSSRRPRSAPPRRSRPSPLRSTGGRVARRRRGGVGRAHVEPFHSASLKAWIDLMCAKAHLCLHLAGVAPLVRRANGFTFFLRAAALSRGTTFMIRSAGTVFAPHSGVIALADRVHLSENQSDGTEAAVQGVARAENTLAALAF